MAWYEDLSSCDYFGKQAAPALRAVGWLERDRPFSVGEVERVIFDRMKELCEDPWQPSASCGPHQCDLCLYDTGPYSSRNVFVPANGFIYVCPDLIVHYMAAHAYAPPPEFRQAVMSCPKMRSMDYLKAIRACGGSSLRPATDQMMGKA